MDSFNYLRQVNGVNGGDTVFVRRVFVPSRPVNQTSLKQLNLWTSNLTCMSHPQGQSGHNPLKIFLKIFPKGHGQGQVTPKFLGNEC